jgi:hypothetical protein
MYDLRTKTGRDQILHPDPITTTCLHILRKIDLKSCCSIYALYDYQKLTLYIIHKSKYYDNFDNCVKNWLSAEFIEKPAWVSYYNGCILNYFM